MFKRYLNSESGTAVGDLWDDIGRVANTSSERLGYDTQKPEELLRRVLMMGSREGDIVLDVFGGSGTTAAAAHKLGRRWVSADISPNTTGKFIAPRLERVVSGDDNAGISQSSVETPEVEGLPSGFSSDDYAAALKAMQAAQNAGLLDEEPSPASVLASLRRLARKRKTIAKHWSGGGAFRTVTVAPSMYEVTPFGVLLAEWATNGRFARAVAGQLGFDWDLGGPFCGSRGRMRLAVFDGVIGPEEVRQTVSALGDKERVTIVAQAVLPGSDEALKELSQGSKIRKAPRDLLSAGAKRARRRTEAAERSVQVQVDEETAT